MPNPVSRREALALLGAAGVAAVAAACGGGASDPASSGTSGTTGAAPSSTTTTTAPSTVPCVLTPEMTEGPYYIDGMAVRRDITEGKPGAPLRLDLTVVDADGCEPIPGASVEIWHADATGDYSGFGGGGSNTTFLRGIQTADATGKVTFDTLYPGWYPGRAVHIHLKAHKGGNRVHTTQLFFDEDLTDEVYTASPYTTRSGSRTTNSQDSIYRGGGAQSTLVLARSGTGVTGTLTLGIRDAV